MLKYLAFVLVAIYGLIPDASSVPAPLSKSSIEGRDINLGPAYNFTCPGNGAFAHAECDKYYSCYNGLANLFQCQQNWLFDLVYFGCNYPQMTDCGDRPRPPGYPTIPTQPSTQMTTKNPFNCPASDGTFPHPNDCGTYIVCVNWIPFLNRCPDGLVFNPALLQCDWPFNVPGCQVA